MPSPHLKLDVHKKVKEMENKMYNNNIFEIKKDN
jgi:hypothetical protein